MRKRRYILILLLACAFVTSPSYGMSASGSYANPGHVKAARTIFEGVDGLDDISKMVSSGMDKEFYNLFAKHFGEYPSGNHRIVAHWGFSGEIPFNTEPYKSALAKYPKSEVVSLWRNYVKSITEKVMRQTGLPQKQAQALAGVYYNAHLLQDYTGDVLSQLQKPDFIVKNLTKNLKTLLGNRNEIVLKIVEEFDEIPKNLSATEMAERVHAILMKHDLGKNLVEVHKGRLLPSIAYRMTAAQQFKLYKATTGINNKFLLQNWHDVSRKRGKCCRSERLQIMIM